MKDEQRIENPHLKAMDEALREAQGDPGSFEQLSQFERAAFVSGFLGGWMAGIKYQQQQAEAQARALEALRVAVRMVDSKIHQNLLEYAGPSGTLHIPLSRPEIEALRAALRLAEEGEA